MVLRTHIRWSVMLLLCSLVLLPIARVMSATAPHTLTLPTPTINFPLGASAGIVVAPDLIITEPTSTNLTGASVVIGSGYVSGSETLRINGTLTGTLASGITYNFLTSTGTLQLSGTATMSDYEAALRLVTYFNSGGTNLGQQREIHFSLAPITYNPFNGHFYEFISTAPATSLWTTALANADAMTFEGYDGYLVTITSTTENTFAFQSIPSTNPDTFKAYIGATDDPTQGSPAGGGGEGQWFWAAGPEQNQIFCIDPGAAACVAQPGWYQNWRTSISEPNNGGTGESHGVFHSSAQWDDIQDSVRGYIVEYSGDPTTIDFTGVVTIDFDIPTLDIPTSSVNDLPGDATSIVIASDLDIQHPDTALMNGARVNITNFVAGEDVLEIGGLTSGTTPSGIAFTFSPTLGSMRFTGNATVADYEAALSQVTYRNSNALTPNMTARNILFNLTDAVYDPTNGHYFLASSTMTNWSNSLTAASSLTFYGVQGYLATPASQHEQTAAAQSTSQGLTTLNSWLGGSDSTVEGQWTWIAGPEAGTIFCIDPGPACVPQSGAYVNWGTSEPSDSGGEDVLHLNPATNQRWNDASGTQGIFYVTEFGGTASDPTLPTMFDQVTLNLDPITQPTLTIPTTDVTYADGSSGVIPAPDALATSTPDLTAASVYISTNFTAAEDRLEIGGAVSGSVNVTGGYTLNFTYNTITGVMQITGTAPASAYQDALRQVSYRNTNISTPNTNPRTVVYTLGSLLVNPENGHYYQQVSSAVNPNWTLARNAAIGREYYGLQGYLATITSSREASVLSSLTGTLWLGGTDDPTETSGAEGEWEWVTGPEAGTVFCIDNSPPTPPCVAQGGAYTNWSGGQPNNGSSVEHYLQRSGGFTWTDDHNAIAAAYVIEYGGMAGDDISQFVDSVIVNFDSPTLDIPTSSINVVPGASPGIAIAPDADIQHPDTALMSAARATLTNYVSGQDFLEIGGTTSGTYAGTITYAFNTTTGTMTLTGTATVADYEAALRAITYRNNNSSTPNATPRNVVFNLGSGIYNPSNNHYYVSSSVTANWTTANTTANNSVIYGVRGYLATLTASHEQIMAIAAGGTNLMWAGGSDDPALTGGVEGEWEWVTGPEAGTLFCIDPGAAACVPQGGLYNNWNGSQPDNSGIGEHYLQLTGGATQVWNDVQLNTGMRYLIEYGGLTGDPALPVIFDQVTINFESAVQPTLAIGTTSVTYEAGETGVTPAPDTTATAPADIANASVYISTNYVSTEDQLVINNLTAGNVLVGGGSYTLNYSFNSANGVLRLTATSPTSAPASAYEEAMELVQYRNTNTINPNTNPRTVVYTMANFFVNPENGHYYTRIGTGLTWANARSAASTLEYYGLQGYLATITSSRENTSVSQTGADAWLGGSDDPAVTGGAEGDWYWVTGPEAGTLFCIDPGVAACIAQGGAYTNWAGGQPDNSGGTEHSLQKFSGTTWNDGNGSTGLPYIVEFGGTAGDAVSQFIDSVVVNFQLATLDIPTSNVDAVPGATPGVTIAPDLDIQHTDTASMNGARVTLTNFVFGQDILEIGGTTGGTVSGINYSFNTTTGTMTLSGAATVATYETVLRSITYRNTNSSTPNTTPRNVLFNLGSGSYNPTNGHYYLLSSGNATWANANTAANSSFYYGLQGYLATITAQHEQTAAIYAAANSSPWVGGSDDPAVTGGVEGEWEWVTGPEAGTVFCIDDSPPTPPCTAQGGAYINWSGGQPSNSGSSEHYLNLAGGNTLPWNDITGTSSTRYLLEFGGTAGDPVLPVIFDQVTINFLSAAQPTLNIPTSNVTYTIGTTGVIPAPDALATAPANLSAASVYISTNFTSSEDQLLINGNTGGTVTVGGGAYTLTYSYNATTGVMRLSNTAPASAYEEAIRLVQYNNTNVQSPNLSPRTVVYTLASFNVNPENGHYTLLVGSTLNWAAADAAASVLEYYGLQGYLATITSSRENAVINNVGGSATWLGGSDDPALTSSTEGRWYWVRGPEAGTLFCVTIAAGNCPAEPNLFTQWVAGQPDNAGGVENYLQRFSGTSMRDADGTTTASFYVVEFGGMPGDAVSQFVDTVVVNLAYDLDLDIPTSNVTYDLGNAAVVVAPDAVVTSAGNLVLANVYLGAEYTSGDDILEINGTTSGTLPSGIAYTFDTVSGVMRLSGTNSAANYQAALRLVTYRNASLNPFNYGFTRTVSYDIGQKAVDPVTGHYLVRIGTGVTWANANTLANASTHFGWQGYLATIETARENAVIRTLFSGTNMWIGASDDPTYTSGLEGEWEWVTGPAAGTLFCIDPGATACVAQGGRYQNWDVNEPINAAPGEHFIEVRSSGLWNDALGTGLRHYVIEYGGTAGDPAITLRLRDSVTVTLNPPTLTIPDPDITYNAGSLAPVIVAPNADIIYNDAHLLNGMRVALTNYNAGQDFLEIGGATVGTVSGITYTFNVTSGAMVLSGSATVANYEAVLRQIAYRQANPTLPDILDTKPREVVYSLSSLVFNPETRHFYRFVAANAAVPNWTTARTTASASSYFGWQGYLATITSPLEQAHMLATITTTSAWLGATDEPTITGGVVGEWEWMTGPESGTLMCTDVPPGSLPCLLEPNGYTNWNGAGEPNNSGGTEHYAEIIGTSGLWNDINNTSSRAYVVEYGGMAGDPSFPAMLDSVVINFTTMTLDIPTAAVTHSAGVPVVVASNAAVTSPANISGAVVMIGTNFVTGQDQLLINGVTSGTQSGIAFSYNATLGVMTLSGSASPATYESVLRMVSFNTSANPSSVLPRTVYYTLGSLLMNPENGHYYQFVPDSTNNWWSNAYMDARNRTYFGMDGYLTTITSNIEHQLISRTISGRGFIGATDVNAFTGGSEGQWYWMAGPESGTLFCIDAAPSGPPCTPQGGAFTSWMTNEPNNNNAASENFGEIVPLLGWNDVVGTQTIAGYVVEYGGLPGDTVPPIVDQVIVNIIVPPTIDVLEPVGNNDNATTTFNITWTDFDSDSNASISLYYDNNNTGTDGTLIVSGLSEDSATNSYTWDVSSVTPGSYYVYAIINDGVNPPVVDYSLGVLVIDDAPTVISTAPADNAIDVPLNTSITVNFSEAVTFNASSFTLVCNSVTTSFTLNTISPATSVQFTPNSPLAQRTNCVVTVVAAQVRDTAPFPDNMAGNVVFDFTTLDFAPRVINTNPLQNASNVAVTSAIQLTFNEPVTVTAGSFQIDCTGSPAHPFNLSGTIPGTSITLTPTTPLPTSALCTVTVTAAQVADSDVVDPPDNLDGNGDGTAGDNFILNFSTIETAPTVLSITPANGAVNVASDPDIVISFDEAVTAPAPAFTLDCTVTGSGVAFSINPPAGTATAITLTPNAPLANGETCTLTIDETQISDADPVDPPDNLLPVAPVQFTIDNAPMVISHVPAATSTGVSPIAPITITFSEDVTVSTSTFSLDCITSSPHPFTLSGSGATYTLTIDPATPMPISDTCTVTVWAGNVADVDAGDPPDNMTANYTFAFTIVDPAPFVVNTTPDDLATNVTLGSVVTIEFSEGVNYTGSAFSLSCTLSGLAAFTTSPASPATLITLTPTPPLLEGETCTVTITAIEVTDVDLIDPADELPADVSFSFTMGGAPAVASTIPFNGAANIATNIDLTITFTEDVTLTGDWVEIDCTVTGLRSPSLNNVVVTGGASVWVLNPDVDFDHSETCTVTIFGAQVADTDSFDPPDNMLADYVFVISTDEHPPAVASTNPTNGMVDVPVDMEFTIFFTELVTVSPNAFVLDCNGTLIPVTTITPSPATGFVVRLTTPMPINTVCTLRVVATEVSDLDTNDPLDNMVADYQISFTTAPTPDSAPTIIRTAPANGEGNVVRNALITITFSEPVTVTLDSFIVQCSVSGGLNVRLEGGPEEYLLDPGIELVDGEVCTVTILAAGVADVDTMDAPDRMVSDFIFSFAIGTAFRPVEPGEPTLSFKDTDFIIKSADKYLVQRGEVVTFTITYRNPKGITLNQVVITDVFDARFTDMEVISNTLGNTILNGNTLVLQGFSLLPGQSGTLIIQATIARNAPAGVVLNTATLESPDASIHVSNVVEIVILPSELPATGEPSMTLRHIMILLVLIIGSLAGIRLYRGGIYN